MFVSVGKGFSPTFFFLLPSLLFFIILIENKELCVLEQPNVPKTEL